MPRDPKDDAECGGCFGLGINTFCSCIKCKGTGRDEIPDDDDYDEEGEEDD